MVSAIVKMNIFHDKKINNIQNQKIVTKIKDKPKSKSKSKFKFKSKSKSKVKSTKQKIITKSINIIFPLFCVNSKCSTMNCNEHPMLIC
jgi:hypothetical protein